MKSMYEKAGPVAKIPSKVSLIYKNIFDQMQMQIHTYFHQVSWH